MPGAPPVPAVNAVELSTTDWPTPTSPRLAKFKPLGNVAPFDCMLNVVCGFVVTVTTCPTLTPEFAVAKAGVMPVITTSAVFDPGVTPITVPVTPWVIPFWREMLEIVAVEPEAPVVPKFRLTIWSFCTHANVFAVVQVEEVLKLLNTVLFVVPSVSVWPVSVSVTVT